MSTISNPSGTYPDKVWFLSGDVSIQRNRVREESLPKEVNTFGATDIYPGPRPVQQWSIKGQNFTLAELHNWEILAQRPDDDLAAVTLVTGEVVTGSLVAWRRSFNGAHDGNNHALYDAEMTVEVEVPDGLSYS